MIKKELEKKTLQTADSKPQAAEKESTKVKEEVVVKTTPETKDVKIEKKEVVIDNKATISKEAEAVINIYTSFNNTIAHITDMSGATIAKVTGGMVTKQSRLKANPTIAMFISKKIAEEVKDLGIKGLYVRIRAKTRNPAPGPGAHTIVKSLTREGFKILNILDTTRLPRGGPKNKGGRRGRRP
ncbi:MAG: 30S ribosomal protein S11 [Nanoarchaeota archaeon]|jgi:small subunit ribosomal protein S11|nr:30S ribosomal protein S11 [Nanoarchaeota archaeon]